MRLLKFDEEGEPSLVEFVGTNLPPYAILSHTWGADTQEVTYKDIENGTGKHKDGWRKLRFCKERTKHDALQYSWIDTCCIDKSSSAELAEAINSMFSWYRSAERCYVYLSDVSNSTRRWKPAFRKSAWFTRGWTLQELIAPRSVDFFSCEGIFLASRATMEQTVQEITGIAVEALAGAPLSQFSKDQRLAWAANRKTKRCEDAAYCLLGIFDVFIPPIYGEGRENALARLDEQIEKTPKRGRLEILRELKETMMESLRFEQMDARHRTINQAHDETCKWLLLNGQYRDWIDVAKFLEHHGFLWIRGKPGAGKSTLMKFALVEAQKTMKETIIISFFFNARGANLEKSTLGMYRSLFLQLLRKLPEDEDSLEFLDVLGDELGVDYQWSVQTLQVMLEQALQSLKRIPVVCFIDALDECEEQQIRDMVAFFENLGKLSVSTGVRLKVCFASRHYPNITIQTTLSLVLEGQEGHAQDITNYVQSRLKIGESKIAKNIRNDIQKRAAGVFMWVVLVVDILKREYDRGRVHTLRKRLDELPTNLHELFHDILTRDSHDQNQLILCIQWVLFAKEPLSPEQLYYAILAGSEPDTLGPWNPEEITVGTIKHFILDVSKGLTETTVSGSPKVQFIHESVRDFLIKDDGLSSIWPDLKNNFQGRSHDRLKDCCFTYMNQDVDTVTKIPEDLPTASLRETGILRHGVAGVFPFLIYAVQSVLYHSDKAAEAKIAQQDFIRDFPMTRWIKFDNLFKQDQICRHTNTVSLLYILAEYNLASLIKEYPSVISCFDLSNERYGAPFLAAIATGSTESINALADALEDKENRSDEIQRSYTQYHCDENGINFLAQMSEFYLGTVIEHLAGLNNKAILSLALRACEARINTVEYRKSTHFLLAAANGQLDTVRLLLDTEPELLNATTSIKSLAFLLAACVGHRDTVELLLCTEGVFHDYEDNDGMTPLLLAALHNRTDIVRLLLKSGKVDVNAKNKFGYTALQLAARYGYVDIVALLIGKSVIVPHKCNINKLTPLQLAVKHGWKDIVKLLLDTGKVGMEEVDLNALQISGKQDNKDIIELVKSYATTRRLTNRPNHADRRNQHTTRESQKVTRPTPAPKILFQPLLTPQNYESMSTRNSTTSLDPTTFPKVLQQPRDGS
jgi:hypothetical protein